jgi:formylglycine-generating enzyme required for sulfatase activity
LPYNDKHIERKEEQELMKIIITVLFTIISFSVQAQWLLDTLLAANPMVLVEGGTFQMGSSDGLKNERPVHAVTLKSFYIGKFEVTKSLFLAVMDSQGIGEACNDCPIVDRSPEEIDTFLNRLNTMTGKHYRLPTEAEWEYASIGGNKSKGYKYSGSNNLDEVAWYKSNSKGTWTNPVGQKKPNELGLYDMSGNAWELCADWFDNNYYKRSPAANPRNDKKAAHRVVRGGSWRSPEERCYSKARNRNIKDHRKQNGGFRLALDA